MVIPCNSSKQQTKKANQYLNHSYYYYFNKRIMSAQHQIPVPVSHRAEERDVGSVSDALTTKTITLAEFVSSVGPIHQFIDCLNAGEVKGSTSSHSSSSSSNSSICRAQKRAATDNSIPEYEPAPATKIHNDATMNDCTSTVDIDDGASCSGDMCKSGDSNTRNVCTKTQALHVADSNKDNKITLTRKQRQGIARRRRRENAISRANTACRETACSDSLTLL